MLKQHLDPEQHPPHPGEILREDILPRLAITRSAFARHLGITPRTLADLLAERRQVTFEMAQRLGAAIGYGTRYWLGLQAQYDIWRAIGAEPVPVRPLKVRPGKFASAATRD